jgi:hypothetical protein
MELLKTTHTTMRCKVFFGLAYHTKSRLSVHVAENTLVLLLITLSTGDLQQQLKKIFQRLHSSTGHSKEF